MQNVNKYLNYKDAINNFNKTIKNYLHKISWKEHCSNPDSNVALEQPLSNSAPTPHPNKIFPQPPPPTQNNVPSTQNNSNSLKICQ